MYFSLDFLSRDVKVSPNSIGTSLRKKTYKATATMLTLAFGVIMISPGLAIRAQEQDRTAKDASTKDVRRGKKKRTKRTAAKTDTQQIILPPQVIAPAVIQSPAPTTVVEQKGKTAPLVQPGTRKTLPAGAGKVYQPVQREIESAAPLNFADLAKQEALNAAQDTPAEIKAIHPPKERPNFGPRGVPIAAGTFQELAKIMAQPQAPPASPTGISPGPVKTFKGEFLSGTSIGKDPHRYAQQQYVAHDGS